MDSVGQRVKVLRELRGMSQSELGRRVNVTPQAIQSLESDINPRRKTKHVLSIAAALDFDPLYLDPAISAERFRQSLAAPKSASTDSAQSPLAIDSRNATDDDALIDAAIVQARNNINLRLELRGEKISGREYLESLCDELRRLTTTEQ